MEALIPSPCVGVCQIDATTGWCIGCGRNDKELFGWGELPAARQRAVWVELPERMARLRRPVRVLPWSGVALLERLLPVTTLPGTVWSIGVRGASAEFLGSDEAPVDARLTSSRLQARHASGALSIGAPAGLRGFLHVGPQGVEVVLALHEARVRRSGPAVVVEVGDDGSSLLPKVPGERLIDLGLGARSLRFCVRTRDAALLDRLRSVAGRSVLDDDLLLERLVLASPTRVAVSPVGRIEVATPIAPPDGATPMSPHTHFFPEQLRAGVEEPIGVAVPPDYLPLARMFTGAEHAGALDLLNA